MTDDLQMAGEVTVLLVEDRTTERVAIRRMLQPASVVEANDGKQAIQLVERDEAHLFDAVLTDLTMPGVSGVELIAVLDECRPELPVVAMSGYHELPPELAQVPFLRKPFDLPELVGTLQPLVLRSLEQQRRARQARADATESWTLAQRQSMVAKKQRETAADPLPALLRLWSTMDQSR
jgi:two-component system, NtrC family, C4-dicarboxylate transport response regulator DctD